MHDKFLFIYTKSILKVALEMNWLLEVVKKKITPNPYWYNKTITIKTLCHQFNITASL